MADQISPRPLEERLIALLLVFQEPLANGHDHDECVEDSCSRLASSALAILAQNLAFLIRNKDDVHGRAIYPEDIFITMLSWDSYLKGMDDGTLAILVRTDKTTKVLQVRVEPKEKVLDKLAREADKMLLKALLLV